MSTRVNIGGILGLVFKCAVAGMIGTLGYGMIQDEIAEEAANEEIAKGMTQTVEESTYVIADTDSITVTRNQTSHIFNYQYGYVVVRGKVDSISVEAEFTFDEFRDHARIDEALKKGCAIARDFTTKTYDSKTQEEVIKKQKIAAGFAANHCPLPAPRSQQ